MRTVLAYAADRDAQAGVEVAVLDQDICGIGLHGDRVVAVVDGPATESDVVCIDRVCSIGIQTAEVETNGLYTGAVDVDVLKQYLCS